MLVAAIVGLVAAAALAGQTPPTVSLPAISVCEVLTNPIQWNGRLVEIRGVVDYGLRPESICSQQFVTEGHVWPQAIDLREAREGDGSIDSKWVVGSLSYDDFIRGERSSKRKRAANTTAVFIGRLITREKYTLVKTGYGLLGNGFGHLGVFPVQLVVYGVKDVKVTRSPEQ